MIALPISAELHATPIATLVHGLGIKPSYDKCVINHMKPLHTLIVTLVALSTYCQDLYFPPIDNDTWESTSLDDLGWNKDKLPALETFLEDSETLGFMILKDGKIAVESYYNGHAQDSVWYWASAAKSLTAFEIGLLQQDGGLHITSPTSTYLGEGWTSTDADQELAITLRDHLTMTTGLDYNVGDIDCTDPACLTYLNPPDTEWYYHNAPYTLLGDVIQNVSGRSRTLYTFQQLGRTIGLNGLWLDVDYLRVFFSTARSMARFGLLMLADGIWDGQVILQDQAYLNAMRTPSQDINPSYGYLWWLNTGPTVRLPGSTVDFPGKLIPSASADIYMALGRDSQILIVDPSRNIVIVRMGRDPDQSAVPTQYMRDLWSHIDILTRKTTAATQVSPDRIRIFPNPVSDYLHITGAGITGVRLLNTNGQVVSRSNDTDVDVRHIAAGTYIVEVRVEHSVVRQSVSIVR